MTARRACMAPLSPAVRLRAAAAGVLACVLAVLTATAPASAQLGGLPDLPVDLPSNPLGDVDRTARGLADDALDLRALRRARARLIDGLLRDHPGVLERSPADDLVIRAEVLALDPADAALAAAQEEGFTLARERTLGGIGARLVVLAAPPGLSTAQALERLRALDPDGAYDFNHVYTGSGEAPGGDAGAPSPPAGGPASSTRRVVGLIDGGVDAAHEAFAGAEVVGRGFSGAPYLPNAHGVAVGSLLAAEESAGAPTRLLVADVYGGAPTGGAADAVAEALSWMAEEDVPVINISLVGGENALLSAVFARVAAQGRLIVAAVGNDGPGAPPLFPAAHPDVIGVTGVDRRRRALIEACRGEHVMFAARGANLEAAVLGGGWAEVRGTSYAAPLVARLLADARRDGLAPAEALDRLGASARDLGRRGRDPIYGFGLVDEAEPLLLVAD